jgi:sporulation protein YlmC with PRC-barrel domain
MPHLETLRDYRFSSDVQDVRGANIYGQDGEKLGTIDDVIFDHDTGNVRYAVIDTGGWLQSRKFVVPAERIEARGGDESGEKGENEFVVSMTRQQIERLPAYDERLLEEDENWAQYEKRYGESSGWSQSPVLHQEGSSNIFTPTGLRPDPASATIPDPDAVESPDLRREGGVRAEYEPAVTRTMPPMAAESAPDHVAGLRSPKGTAPEVAGEKTTSYMRRRWAAFEDGLRRNRQDILAKRGRPSDQRDVA